MGILEDGLKVIMDSDKSLCTLLDSRFADILQLLNCYIDEIELFNGAYSLVNYTKKDELIVKHILDSLAALPALLRITGNAQNEKQLCFADIGSGAGLPGIPLSIALNKVSFTLIERSGRRANFLADVSASLGLNNVEVIQNDVQKTKAAQIKNAPFDLVTFRALRQLDGSFVKTIFGLLKDGGCIAAYKGRAEKIEEELRMLKCDRSLKCCQGANTSGERLAYSSSVIPIPVPFLDESRHLVVLGKLIL
ncbi:MAG: 16S rRNA (guanine(527)-N(7))-methyltransferase RsmG [Termitinemataceae bacterium]|nr:MAG: 16S rRNA (guanine(527)-N(7))-methyltransferase RsmG [Termitinemataceae bacterium]